MVYKDLGLVAQTLAGAAASASLRGNLAIAHCRYSTTGSTLWENSQPTFRLGPRRTVAIGHNGNLVNTRELLAELPGGRTRLVGTTDTEVLTALLADEPRRRTWWTRSSSLLPRVKGAYSLVVMDEHRVVGARDPYGFRPLVLGRLPAEADRGRRGAASGHGEAPTEQLPWAARGTDPDEPVAHGGWVLASETAALDVLGADFVRDVEPGELVVLGEPGGPRSIRFAPGKEQLCVFELIYFARPDTYMLGRNLYEVRRRMGEALAREAPADADMVMPVPDTGAPAAAGYAEASGIPYREGMVKNRYAGRTFIQPSQSMRQRGVNMKLSPLREEVRGKRLVVVDDSIVRGTTTRQIVQLLRRAGAARGPRAHQRAAHLPPLLLRHRHVHRDRAHRVAHGRRGDPGVHRRRLAGLPVDRRRADPRSTCRATASASPASTASTRCRSRTTWRRTSSCWRPSSCRSCRRASGSAG